MQVLQTSQPSDADTVRGTQGVANKISVAMNTTLVEPYLREEVIVALKQMTPLKSPDLMVSVLVSTRHIGTLSRMS